MEPAHSILTSPLLTVLVSLLIMGLVGLLVATVVYMLRMGVQFAIQDLLIGTLTTGFPPAIGGMLVSPESPAYKIWVSAGAISFLVLVYLIYGFYWASIRPHPTEKGRFWQRFAVPLSLAGVGSVLLWVGAV